MLKFKVVQQTYYSPISFSRIHFKSVYVIVPDKSKKPKEAKTQLYDLDLSELKLSDEDAIALSYLTPGLSRRIQNQLLSQLPPTRKDKSQSKISPKSPKDYVFSDSSDSELFSGRNNDSLLDEYNFPRPPKHSYSSSKASEYSPIAESPILQDPKLETNHVESKPLNIYRLEDIKKEYNIDKTDNNKYTPFKNCYRSTSLVEPSSSSSSYKNPLYFRNVNYSSESFDSKYGSDKPISSSTPTKYNTINPRTYGLTKHHEDIEDPLSTTRRTSSSSSRFGTGTTTNYYDNCVYSKERKKRELETQKVLKEIRNKRINDHRDKYSSREPKNTVTSEPIVNHTFENHNYNHNHESVKSEKSGDTSSECSTVDKSNKSDEKEEKSIKREGKISKLIRPKSYPTECRTETRTLTNVPGTKSKLKKRSPSVDKSSPAKDLQNSDGKKHSNNQFLSSIEKKIRSFYSESQPNNDKVKNDVNSRIQSTIRSLREQSEPRNIENCVTESGLIKRAVSSEDFSVFGSNTKPIKTLQPSRKSVSKILGLFKKYEDKDKSSTKTAKTEENGTTKKNKSSVDGINKKIKTKSDASSPKTKKESSKTPVNTEANDASKKSSNSTSKLKSLSKLPKRGVSVEPDLLPEKRQPIPVLELPKPKLPVEETAYKPERKDLKLNLTKKSSDFKYRDSNNDVSTDNDNSSALFSPCDESNDSWSICSDMHRQDMSPNGESKLYSEDEGNESVSDRIRRKSFYCRFNEKKKPRKTSLADYTKFDLKYPEVASSNSKSSRSSKKYDDSLHKSLSNSSYAYNPTKNDSKLCKRTLSMNDNYYNTYNPKYRESSIPLNTSSSSNEKSVDYNNEKSLTMKPKRSLLKTPTKIRDRMSMSSPLHEFDHFGPSTSNNHDIPAPM